LQRYFQTSPAGRFTARKERQARGGGYWKAYRTSHGTLHRVYLGKAQDLTLDRLNHAATTLAAASDPSSPVRATPPALPEGTLTFLFTDIVGSTTMWEAHPQAMAPALARHDAILKQVITASAASAAASAGARAAGALRQAFEAVVANRFDRAAFTSLLDDIGEMLTIAEQLAPAAREGE